MQDIDLGPMEYVTEKRNLSDEPPENWESKEYFVPAITTGPEASSMTSSVGTSLKRGYIANSLRASVFSTSNNVLRKLVATAERPTEIHDLHDVQINEFKNQMSCFL